MQLEGEVGSLAAQHERCLREAGEAAEKAATELEAAHAAGGEAAQRTAAELASACAAAKEAAGKAAAELAAAHAAAEQAAKSKTEVRLSTVMPLHGSTEGLHD